MSRSNNNSYSLLILIIISTLVGVTSSSSLGFAKKIAILSGDQVVPPVSTTATGRATFKHPDETTMNYKVNITGILHPSGMNVHLGKTGTNGDSIIDLMKQAESVNKWYHDCNWKLYRTGSDGSNEGKNYFRACRFNEKWR
ncbi:MAG: CHRD domain-containing protein [Nitrososphaeraceae archaeon]